MTAGSRSHTQPKHAREGQIIRVRGTCRERIQITTARLTLAGPAIIDGTGVELGADQEFDGLLVIEGVAGVTVSGLMIQNSAGNGILAERGAALVLNDVRVQDNAVTGIVVVDHSSAEVANCAISRNRLGLDVVTSSSAVLRALWRLTRTATA